MFGVDLSQGAGEPAEIEVVIDGVCGTVLFAGVKYSMICVNERVRSVVKKGMTPAWPPTGFCERPKPPILGSARF